MSQLLKELLSLWVLKVGSLSANTGLGSWYGDSSSTEIVRMLLVPNQIVADQVQNRVETIATEGLDEWIFYWFSPYMIIEKYMNLTSKETD